MSKEDLELWIELRNNYDNKKACDIINYYFNKELSKYLIGFEFEFKCKYESTFEGLYITYKDKYKSFKNEYFGYVDIKTRLFGIHDNEIKVDELIKSWVIAFLL